MSNDIAPTEKEVASTVVQSIATALDMKPEDIELSGSLEADYGAESLDVLEIVFLLEKAYRIRLPRMSLMQHAEEHFGQGVLADKGQVTDLGLSILRRMRPEIDPSYFQPGLRVGDVGRFLTPQTFVRLTLRLLEIKAEERERLRQEGCAQCGKHRIVDSSVAPEFVCEDCGADYPVPNGDDILLQDLLSLDLSVEK